MEQKILYPELSYKINGLCFKTHNDLGRFAKEKQYCDRLDELLKDSDLEYQREVRLYFRSAIDGGHVGGNIADFIIENTIIIECKAKRLITKEDYYQIQRYLHVSKLKLGFIVNFRDRYLKPKRVINYSYHSY